MVVVFACVGVILRVCGGMEESPTSPKTLPQFVADVGIVRDGRWENRKYRSKRTWFWDIELNRILNVDSASANYGAR